VSGAATDAELGVDEFHTKYFDSNPLYLDRERNFYKILGNKSLLSQSWSSWNPFKLYSDLKEVDVRVKAQGIDGNLKGEGLLQGGVLIIHPVRGIVYRHNERTGAVLPFDEMKQVLDSLADDTDASVGAGGAGKLG
jgi:NADH:ubiquinone oxidoreductase subunit